MGERMDRAMSTLDEVLHGPKPESPPSRNFSFGEWSPNPPTPPDPDDLYWQAGGGWGSRSEDAREAHRVQVELQAAEARRRAREAETQQGPLHERIVEVERRLAQLEDRGGKSSPEQEARGFDERRDRTSSPPGVEGEWPASIPRPPQQ